MVLEKRRNLPEIVGRERDRPGLDAVDDELLDSLVELRAGTLQ
jgi:hypothetical protein